MKMHKSDREYFYSLIKRPSVFKNETCLSGNYIPNYLPHREEELRTLAYYFKNFFTTLPLQHVLVTGPTGSGKTTLAKRFAKLLKNVKENDFYYVYINCRIYKNEYPLINAMLKSIDVNTPVRGFSLDELKSMLIESLELYKTKMLVILDEFDYLISHTGSEFLYSLLRINETTSKQWVSYIFIARNLNFLKYLDSSTMSSFQSSHISLDKYSASDLADIIKARINSAFYEDTVTDDAVELIADLGAENGGDARYAIELLWAAGKCADEERSPIVYPDHVRKAKSLIYPELRRDTIFDLNLHQKLLLLAIIRKLKYTKNAYVSTSEVIDSYVLVCEEYKEKPRKHTQIWLYLKELSKQKVIQTKISGEGIKGKTTLISLIDAPVEQLEKFLLKTLMKEFGGSFKGK